MDRATFRKAMTPTALSDGQLFDLLPLYEEAMRAAEINTPRRAAAFASQLGHESSGLRYTAEIQTDGPGWTPDRRVYRGRGYIQLTWSSNYRKFGQWCKEHGYVSDSEIFVKSPALVEQPKWGFLASSWYWMYGGPKPGKINGFADAGDILSVSRCVNGWSTNEDGTIRIPNGMTDRQKRWDNCLPLGDALLPGEAMPDNRPAFNEFPIWSSNNSSRNDVPIDCFFIHTQEGGGGDNAAEALSNWYKNGNGVSYHYAVSQASDGGVTVVDNVDTDRASWSVLSANSRSINACFAGSRSSWTREEWLTKAGNAIDVMAYLAVQDAKKYNFAIQVIPPPYTGRIPGISDHAYVTKVLGDGTHTDVGQFFPWDVFAAAVKKYASGEVTKPDVPVTVKRFPDDWTDRELTIELLRQQRGATLEGWPQLGGRTQVDYLAHLGQKVDALAQVVARLAGEDLPAPDPAVDDAADKGPQ